MFSKKIIVIKQITEGFSAGTKPVCGICRLEKENGVLTVLLSLIGFAAQNYGTYRLYVADDSKTLVGKDIGKIPASCTFHFDSALSLDKGISAGVWLIRDDIPLLIAYQKSDDAKTTLKEYRALVVNEIIAERKLKEREKEFEIPEPPTENSPFDPVKIYNDEAVATENFYAADEMIREKLDNIKELNYERIRNEDDDDDYFRPKEPKESEKNFDFSQNETHAGKSESDPYYATVKSELESIFDKHPAEEKLQNAIPGSRFAKVYYTEDKFYVVGVIKENGKEKYICYGIPSAYRETPPKELAGYCSFVPLSIFDLKGDGYFMMFQDAFTGKCVKMK